jgi:hypothetical protein
MTITMSELVDAESCDVLRGGDGPVYFLLGGQLYVVHEVLGRWIEPDSAAAARPVFEREGKSNSGTGAGPTVPEPRTETPIGQPDRSPTRSMPPAPSVPSSSSAPSVPPEQPAESTPAHPQRPGSHPYEPLPAEPALDEAQPDEPRMVEHWLVTASVGRFGRPAVFRLQRRPAPPAKGPDTWTVRAERR